MELRPENLREDLEHLLYGLLLPYLLRAGLLGLLFAALDRLLGTNVRRLCLTGSAITGEREALDVDTKCTPALLLRSSWEDVRIMLGWTRKQAITVSILRLFFWHNLQPFLYSLVFYAYHDLLMTWPDRLGFAVLARESSYLLYTWIGAVNKPAFLLFSPARAGCHDNIMYVAMPEKFVLRTSCSNVWLRILLILATFLADLCGILALIISIQSRHVYLPLMAGYVVTTVSFLPTLYYMVDAALRRWPRQIVLGNAVPPTRNTWFNNPTPDLSCSDSALLRSARLPEVA